MRNNVTTLTTASTAYPVGSAAVDPNDPPSKLLRYSAHRSLGLRRERQELAHRWARRRG